MAVVERVWRWRRGGGGVMEPWWRSEGSIQLCAICLRVTSKEARHEQGAARTALGLGGLLPFRLHATGEACVRVGRHSTWQGLEGCIAGRCSREVRGTVTVDGVRSPVWFWLVNGHGVTSCVCCSGRVRQRRPSEMTCEIDGRGSSS